MQEQENKNLENESDLIKNHISYSSCTIAIPCSSSVAELIGGVRIRGAYYV